MPSERTAMKKTKGFTLIELMISVAIIGILSSIAIPSYLSYLEAARSVEAQNNIATLKAAQEEFFLENNTYFTGADAAAINTASGGLWTVEGSDFDYAITGGGNTYTITATGESGTDAEGLSKSYTK